MKIVIDGFGGDNSPGAVVEGAVAAAEEYGAKIVITGDKDKLQVAHSGIEIVHADGVIEVEDDPALIRSAKAGSSMGVAFGLLKSGEADAMVSGGSTAALMVGGSTIVGRIKGVKRPALAPIMPGVLPDGAGACSYLLLDGGANLDCRPEMLVQFAVMGSIYAEKVMGVKNPRIGLLNIGTEPEKGRELDVQTHALLKSAAGLNFVGNVEAREVPLGVCDVAVADGFTGNIYLKTVEGMGKYMKQSLKDLFGRNAATKVGYLLAKSGVREISRRADYRETGGSPLLGTAKPIIKAHGSSDSLAFKNAIRQAIEFVESGAIEEIAGSV